MTFASGDPHLAAMQKLVVAPEALSKTDRIKLNFALGKAYADLKDHRRSFQHLLAANAGKRAMVAYDEPVALALFDRIEATFSCELIAARSGGGDPSRRPIFVLGMPRSGTTLVEQILASHPMVHGAGELETLSEVVLAVGSPGSTTIPYTDFVPALDRAALMSIGAHYLAALNERVPSGERVTDKMPTNYYFAGLIHLALPNAKIIHTVRDPLDTCMSCFSKLFAGAQNHTYDLGELGRYYKRYERLMTHWRRVLPPDRILDVRHEDVVADLETQERRIVSYCGLPWSDLCLSFHETDRPVRTASVTQVRKPIYKSAVGRWRDCEEFIGPLLTALDLPAREDR
jgi:Sulfotransferase family